MKLFRTRNKSQSNIEKLLSRQLTTINIVVASIGIMFLIAISGLGYLQIKSSDELSTTAKEMKADLRYNMEQLNKGFEKDIKNQQEYIENYTNGIEKKVDTKIEDFEKQFNQIVGKATQPALLNVYYKKNIIINSKITIPFGKIGGNNKTTYSSLPRINIKNDGGKTTNKVILYVLSDHDLNLGMGTSDSYPPGYWNRTDQELEGSFVSKAVYKSWDNPIEVINPMEYWTVELPAASINKDDDKIRIRIEIYYGVDKPTIAEITFEKEL